MSEEGGEVVYSIHLIFAILPCFSFNCEDSSSFSAVDPLRATFSGLRLEVDLGVKSAYGSRFLEHTVSSLITLAQVCKVSRLVVTFHRGAGWHYSLAKQGTHRGRRLLTCSHQISVVIIAASRGVVWCDGDEKRLRPRGPTSQWHKGDDAQAYSRRDCLSDY